MKRMIFLLLVSLTFISCSNTKDETVIIPLKLKVEEPKKEETEKVAKTKTVTIEKLNKKNLIRKVVVDVPYTEYIF